MRNGDRKWKIEVLTQNQLNMRTITWFANSIYLIPYSEIAVTFHLENLDSIPILRGLRCRYDKIVCVSLSGTEWATPCTDFITIHICLASPTIYTSSMAVCLVPGQSRVYKFHDIFIDIKVTAIVTGTAYITDQRIPCMSSIDRRNPCQGPGWTLPTENFASPEVLRWDKKTHPYRLEKNFLEFSSWCSGNKSN